MSRTAKCRINTDDFEGEKQKTAKRKRGEMNSPRPNNNSQVVEFRDGG
jgi:hypothetical protein